jgi:hypothetical protein
MYLAIIVIASFIIATIAIFLIRAQKSRRSQRLTLTTTSTSTTTTTTLAPQTSPSQEILQFIAALEKYTCLDIQILQKIARDAEATDNSKPETDPLRGTGRCSTALASLCFAAVEELGLTIRILNATNVNQAMTGDNKENATEFFSFFYANGLSHLPLISKDEVWALYFLFRNKITHNLFARETLGISQNVANPLNQLIVNVGSSHSLNVNFLSNYVLEAVAVLKRMVNDPANNLLVLRLNTNIQLIRANELVKMRGHYNSMAGIRPYYNTWLPHIVF